MDTWISGWMCGWMDGRGVWRMNEWLGEIGWIMDE